MPTANAYIRRLHCLGILIPPGHSPQRFDHAFPPLCYHRLHSIDRCRSESWHPRRGNPSPFNMVQMRPPQHMHGSIRQSNSRCRVALASLLSEYRQLLSTMEPSLLPTREPTSLRSELCLGRSRLRRDLRHYDQHQRHQAQLRHARFLGTEHRFSRLHAFDNRQHQVRDLEAVEQGVLLRRRRLQPPVWCQGIALLCRDGRGRRQGKVPAQPSWCQVRHWVLRLKVH